MTFKALLPELVLCVYIFHNGAVCICYDFFIILNADQLTI